MKNSRRQHGFTLIEILIVVAILGVLVGIALPAYNQSVLRSNRAEAKSELMQVASEQERYFSSFNTYIDDALPLNTPTVADRDRTTQNGHYVIGVAAGPSGIGTSFIATATPQGDQTEDECTTLTITNTGVRGATGATADECWQR
ncbi:MAG: type IV pilin protein [Pseudohongiellaceae bacterium]